MSEWENPKEDLSHPDSAIRLASAVHRFRVPTMSKTRSISFARSFRTVGKHEKTRKALVKADDNRMNLDEALSAPKVSHERVVAEARRYQPFIHQVLLSCKVQPEMARLDERLIFEWASGVETDKNKMFKSEAIMYDLVMCVVSEGLGKAGVATESSIAGEFAAASREYAAAAGIFAFLAEDHLPKWIARGSQMDEDELPVECSVGVAQGLSMLFKANGQQMAIATVLIKPDTPNYSLLGKLCLGVVEELEEFIAHMRESSFRMMSRMDKDFFTLVTFQINIQKSLSMYFQARAQYDTQKEYGLGIAMLSEAASSLKTRTSEAGPGLPDVSKIPSLKPLQKDLTDLQNHMQKVLRAWEKDNSQVFFEPVPKSVPTDKKLQQGVKLSKSEKYKIGEVEPLYLVVPEPEKVTSRFFGKKKPSPPERSDSDIARELQERLNAGLDD